MRVVAATAVSAALDPRREGVVGVDQIMELAWLAGEATAEVES